MSRRPTDAECAVFRARYAEADAALHQLRVYGATVRVRTGDKESQFTAADIGALQQYRDYLNAKVCVCDGIPCCGRRGRLTSIIPVN